MAENQIGPISLSERIEVLDVLRGLAICGILVGNMQWFSGYGMLPPALAAQTPLYDQITHFLVHFFIEGKFYSIFSFLFGFGFALQIARAEARGDVNASLFKRRLFWLLIIGLLHGWLLWPGDILSVYAVMGFLLILFRKKSNESLLKWAAVLIAVPVVTASVIYVLFISFAPPDTAAKVAAMQADSWSGTAVTVSQGNYWEILRSYNLPYILGRYAGLILQMRLPKILAMFLLGFYAYRLGYFQNLSAHGAFIRKVLIYGLALGVIGNLIFVSLAKSEADVPPSLPGLGGVIGYAFGVPALALGITALVATLWQKDVWQKILSVLAPVGRMALTNYLLQTVVCITIFYGYGFGQFGKVGALTATLIALGIFAGQIVLSNIWLRYFAYGPMEWIWRQLTYRKRLALRRERTA
jgi:uncharacterized protein